MLKKNPVVINKQKRKATRKLLKSKKKGKLNKKVIEKFENIKSKKNAGSRKRSRNIDDDVLDYRQLRFEEQNDDFMEANVSDEEILPTDMLDEDIDFENSVFFKKRRKLVDNDDVDESVKLRKFKSDVGEDETELLPIKLKTGELVRLKKKVVPISDGLEDEEPENKEEKEKKAKEEDFSHLSASELLAKRRELQSEIREKIASAAHVLTINPQDNILRLRELYKYSAGEQVHSIVRESIQKLATVSLVQILVDIVPGYPIRQLSDVEKSQQMKKETKRLFDYEQILLRYYVKFLQLLEKNAMKIAKRDQKRFNESTFTHKIAIISAKCLCRLLNSAPHFNYSTNIITCLSRLSISNFKPLVKEACSALAEMFENDRSFKISLHAVKTIASLVNKKKCYVPPELLKTFLSLKIRYEKQLKKLEADLKEAEAAESLSTKLKYATEALKHVFATYFRVIKRMPSTSLLNPVLAGLSKFAHLINVEFFDDLISSLGELVDQQHLKVVDALHCVKTVFVILSGEGQALNIDPIKFYKALYERLTAIPFQKDLDVQFHEVQLVVECLDFMINKRKKLVPLGRVAAFIKRLLSISFFLSSTSVVAILSGIRNYFITHPRLSLLIEEDSDAIANGIFNPDLNDPDCSNALSSNIVEELNIFSTHPDKIVTAFAQNILNKIPSNGNYRLSPQWSTVPPHDWITINLVKDAESPYKELIFAYSKKHKQDLTSKILSSTVQNWISTYVKK